MTDRTESRLESLDAALRRLRLPTTTDERMGILKALVGCWFGPSKSDPEPRDLQRVSLPSVLRQWYSIVGRRKEIFDPGNAIIGVEPSALEANSDSKLLIFVENQGVFLWATEVEGQDPPVWGRFNEADDPWERLSESLSESLIALSIHALIMRAPYRETSCWLPQADVDRLIQVLPELPLPAWTWPDRPSRFYGARGAFMFTCPNGECDGTLGYSVWIGSLAAEPIALLKERVVHGWDDF